MTSVTNAQQNAGKCAVEALTRDDVVNVVGRYADCLDRRDFVAFQELFTEDLVAEYAGGDPVTGRDGIVGFVQRVALADLTQHFLVPNVVECDGATASVSFHGVAVAVTGERAVVRGLTYTAQLVATPDGAQIRGIQQQALWATEMDVTQNPGALFAGGAPR
ncbi:nuclear transport factor 2 family protein [Georgenia sp. SYP-B2076]|uniref:nuclear transport factor 2 family protein n=1 Tax=Georgenia sp. SYP-B2076 TaxID=2495881 RepID=UPI0013DF0781|nr:nuclear transport factor 2 family protein [Georgenia sp. SYP-B2076]